MEIGNASHTNHLYNYVATRWFQLSIHCEPFGLLVVNHCINRLHIHWHCFKIGCLAELTISWIHKNLKIIAKLLIWRIFVQSATEMWMLQNLRWHHWNCSKVPTKLNSPRLLLQVNEDTQTVMSQLYRYSFTVVIQSLHMRQGL